MSADGRCDSPGYNAKFLTYSFHVSQLNKIVHSEQVQVGECDQVKLSTQMEKEGLLRGLAFFKAEGVAIKSLTTDRHPSIRKHMMENEKSIVHYFDGWHISKGGYTWISRAVKVTPKK